MSRSCTSGRWARHMAAALFCIAGLTGVWGLQALGAQQASPGTASKTSVKVYGEFEDQFLFEKALQESPEMKDWSDEELWDGLSGATLQAKTLEYDVPERVVWLGTLDEVSKGTAKILAYADGFGQYWFRIEPGTWTLSATCEGYQGTQRTLTIQPGSNLFVNFFLKRK